MGKVLLLLLFFFHFSFAQSSKKALIIAIGNYPEKNEWQKINAINDIPLITQALKTQGFKESSIVVLEDAQAKKSDILKAFDNLLNNTNSGDIIVIHISAHGQQVSDLSSDEIDDLDEAIIPYDAHKKYSKTYQGENHLTDDELGALVNSLRLKVGLKGQVLLMLDTCHSGTAARGAIVRGTSEVFQFPNSKKENNGKTKGSDMWDESESMNDMAPFILISASAADESNYEYKNYGSLSYAFSNVISEIDINKPKITYRELFSNIKSKMNLIASRQTPTIEGDQDWELFGKDRIIQTPYFEIDKIREPNTVEIQAGRIQGVFENSTVLFLPKNTKKPSLKNIITSGKVTQADYNSSIITLDSLFTNKLKNSWIFINKKSYGEMGIEVFVEPSTKKDAIINKITNYLNDIDFVSVVSDQQVADIVIDVTEDKITNLYNYHGDLIASYSTEGESYDSLKNSLFTYAQGQYLKNISLKNPDYEFELRYIPIDLQTEKELKFDDYVNDKGLFEVGIDNDYVKLEVKNKSDIPIYFNVLEINSKGELNAIMSRCNEYQPQELRILPYQTIQLSCVFNFGPPYERLMLKGFATSTPLHFEYMVKNRGEVRGDLSPLEQLLSNSFQQSRGKAPDTEFKEVECHTTEFVYEIVKTKK